MRPQTKQTARGREGGRMRPRTQRGQDRASTSSLMSWCRRACRKCAAAYGGDTTTIGTRLTDPTTFEDIEWAVRDYKESFAKALHGARGVDGARASEVVGTRVPPLYHIV